MRSLNGSIHTTQTPPPLSFYNTFKQYRVFIQNLDGNTRRISQGAEGLKIWGELDGKYFKIL